MNGLRLDAEADLTGTSLQGEVDVSYADLVRVFGPPNVEGDNYKTDAEWALVDDDGNTVTIYNYKSGRNYLGAEGMDTEDIRDWHVGGHTPDAVRLVEETLHN